MSGADSPSGGDSSKHVHFDSIQEAPTAETGEEVPGSPVVPDRNVTSATTAPSSAGAGENGTTTTSEGDTGVAVAPSLHASVVSKLASDENGSVIAMSAGSRPSTAGTVHSQGGEDEAQKSQPSGDQSATDQSSEKGRPGDDKTVQIPGFKQTGWKGSGNSAGSSAGKALWKRAAIAQKKRTVIDILRKPFQYRTRNEYGKVLRELGRLRFFSQLPEATLNLIARKARIVQCDKGEVMYAQGATISRVLYILDGKVALHNKFKSIENNHGGTGDINVRNYGLVELLYSAGDALGEELITGQPVDADRKPLTEGVKPAQQCLHTARCVTEVTMIECLDWDMPDQLWPLHTSFCHAFATNFFSLPPVRRSIDSVKFMQSQMVRQFGAGVASLDDASLEGIARVATIQRLSQGEVLFEQGSPGGAWYLIYWSACEVRKKDDLRAVDRAGYDAGRKTLDDALGKPIVIMKRGQVMGELAMESGAKRQASIVGLHEFEVLTVKSEVFSRIMQSRAGATFVGTEWRTLIDKCNHEPDEDDLFVLISMMQTIRFFQQLPEELVSKLATTLQFHEYKPGDVIVKQGDNEIESFCLYVILQGNVSVHVMPSSQPIRFEAWRVGALSSTGVQRNTTAQAKLRELCLGRHVFEMKVGDSFGERALLSGEKRSSTCVALDTVHVAALPRAKYMQVIESMPSMDYQPDKIAIMLEREPRDRSADDISSLTSATKSLGAFRNMPMSVLAELCRGMTLLNFVAHDVIFHQGEIGSYMAVILEGTVAIFVKTATQSNDDNTAEDVTSPDGAHDQHRGIVARQERMFGKLVHQLGPGNVIGESMMYNDPPYRTSTIVSREPCKLMVIEQKAAKPHVRVLCKNYAFENKFLISSLRKDGPTRTAQEREVIFKQLQGMHACRSLPSHALKQITSIVSFVDFPKGHVVAGMGDTCTKVLILMNGLVGVFGSKDRSKGVGSGSDVTDLDQISVHDDDDGATAASGGHRSGSRVGGNSSVAAQEEEEEEEEDSDDDLEVELGTPDTRLRDGKSIGEMEIVTSKPFASTFVAWQPSRFIVLTREQYMEHLLRFQPTEIYRTATWLKNNVDAFATTDISRLLSLARHMIPKTFARGQEIMTEGSSIAAFCIVREGELRVTRQLPGTTKGMRTKRWLVQGMASTAGEDATGGVGDSQADQREARRRRLGASSIDVTRLGPSACVGEDLVAQTFDQQASDKVPEVRSNFTVVAETMATVLTLDAEDCYRLTTDIADRIAKAKINKSKWRRNQMESQVVNRTTPLDRQKRVPTAEYHLDKASLRNFGSNTNDTAKNNNEDPNISAITAYVQSPGLPMPKKRSGADRHSPSPPRSRDGGARSRRSGSVSPTKGMQAPAPAPASIVVDADAVPGEGQGEAEIGESDNPMSPMSPPPQDIIAEAKRTFGEDIDADDEQGVDGGSSIAANRHLQSRSGSRPGTTAAKQRPHTVGGGGVVAPLTELMPGYLQRAPATSDARLRGGVPQARGAGATGARALSSGITRQRTPAGIGSGPLDGGELTILRALEGPKPKGSGVMLNATFAPWDKNSDTAKAMVNFRPESADVRAGQQKQQLLGHGAAHLMSVADHLQRARDLAEAERLEYERRLEIDGVRTKPIDEADSQLGGVRDALEPVKVVPVRAKTAIVSAIPQQTRRGGTRSATSHATVRSPEQRAQSALAAQQHRVVCAPSDEALFERLLPPPNTRPATVVSALGQPKDVLDQQRHLLNQRLPPRAHSAEPTTHAQQEAMAHRRRSSVSHVGSLVEEDEVSLLKATREDIDGEGMPENPLEKIGVRAARLAQVRTRHVIVPTHSKSRQVLARTERRKVEAMYQKKEEALAPWARGANRVDRAIIINGPDGRSRVMSVQRFARAAKSLVTERKASESKGAANPANKATTGTA